MTDEVRAQGRRAISTPGTMDGQEIAEWLAPTFDLYLTGTLDD